jgi:hypothetical protein
VARYLGDPTPSPDDEYWLPTGDIFRQRESGYYEIVDRIKDIYKNANGQTVAPGAIEQKLTHVPGIARSFLVGDGREYNVLLIVPDLTDPVLSDGPESERTLEYFQQVVTTANQGLAPFERVVNFAVLDRDFERERGELTPKGSFQRKTIEENFQGRDPGALPEKLRPVGGERPGGAHSPVVLPGPGILETDIVPQEDGLWNRRSHVFLTVAPTGERRDRGGGGPGVPCGRGAWWTWGSSPGSPCFGWRILPSSASAPARRGGISR